jgi:hypothetical protein
MVRKTIKEKFMSTVSEVAGPPPMIQTMRKHFVPEGTVEGVEAVPSPPPEPIIDPVLVIRGRCDRALNILREDVLPALLERRTFFVDDAVVAFREAEAKAALVESMVNNIAAETMRDEDFGLLPGMSMELCRFIAREERFSEVLSEWSRFIFSEDEEATFACGGATEVPLFASAGESTVTVQHTSLMCRLKNALLPLTFFLSRPSERISEMDFDDVFIAELELYKRLVRVVVADPVKRSSIFGELHLLQNDFVGLLYQCLTPEQADVVERDELLKRQIDYTCARQKAVACVKEVERTGELEKLFLYQAARREAVACAEKMDMLPARIEELEQLAVYEELRSRIIVLAHKKEDTKDPADIRAYEAAQKEAATQAHVLSELGDFEKETKRVVDYESARVERRRILDSVHKPLVEEWRHLRDECYSHFKTVMFEGGVL